MSKYGRRWLFAGVAVLLVVIFILIVCFGDASGSLNWIIQPVRSLLQ